MKRNAIFKKQFYTYYYYKIKRERPLDYIFFDWKTFFVLVSIFLLGVLLFFPYKISISIPIISSQIYILESLRYTVSIFIAITFSFIILSFNIFNRYFGRYVFLDFFKSRSVQICITLLVSTLILLIYSISFLQESEQSNSFTDFLYIFSILISLISFFSIFPFLINVLRNSQSRKNIIHLFEKIDNKWAENEFVSEIEDDKISFYQKDPINILNEIGLMSIKDFDNITFEIITSNIVSYFKNITELKDDKSLISIKKIYYRFNQLLSNLYQLSTKEMNEIHSSRIIRSRIEIEEIVLKNIGKENFKEFTDYDNKYKHWDLNFTIEDFFKRAIQLNEDEVCSNIIQNYSSFIEKSIVNLYPKNINYSKDQHFEIATKSDSIFEPLRIIVNLSKMILLHKKMHLFQQIFTTFYVVEQAVLKIDTTNNTKCFLYNVILNYKIDTFNLYVNSSEVDYIESSFFPFDYPIYTYEKTKCSIPYFGLLNILDTLFSMGKLNNIVLNKVKAEMLHLLKIEDTSNNLLFRAIEKFEEISSRIKDSDSDYKKDIYLRLLENLRIVHRVAAQEKSATVVITRLSNSIERYSNSEKYANELKDKGYISDERII